MEPVSPTRAWHIFTLLALLAVAGWMRVVEVQRGPLVPDEVWALELSTGRGSAHAHVPEGVLLEHLPPSTGLQGAAPWYRVPASLTNTVNPPAYPTLLGFFRATFSGSDEAARMLSAILSLFAVLFIFDALRLLLTPGAALWACAIVVSSRPWTEVGTEVRAYGLLMLLSTAALAGFARLLRDRPRSGSALLGIGTLGMLLTHYFSCGLILSLGIAAPLLLDSRRRTLALTTLASSVLLFLVLWGPTLLRQYHSARFSERDDANEFLLRPGPGLPRALENLASLPTRLIYITRPNSYPAAYGAALVWLLPLALQRRPRGKTTTTTTPTPSFFRRNPAATLLGLYAVGGILVPATLDAIRSTAHLEYMRYAILPLPAFAGLIAAVPLWASATLSRFAARLTYALPVIACIAGALSLSPIYGEQRLDSVWLVTQVDKSIASDDVVVFAGFADPPYVPRTLLLVYSHLTTTDRPVIVTRAPLDAATLTSLHSRLGPKGKLWVLSEPGFEHPATFLPGFTHIRTRVIIGMLAIHLLTPDAPLP